MKLAWQSPMFLGLGLFIGWLVTTVVMSVWEDGPVILGYGTTELDVVDPKQSDIVIEAATQVDGDTIIVGEMIGWECIDGFKKVGDGCVPDPKSRKAWMYSVSHGVAPNGNFTIIQVDDKGRVKCSPIWKELK